MSWPTALTGRLEGSPGWRAAGATFSAPGRSSAPGQTSPDCANAAYPPELPAPSVLRSNCLLVEIGEHAPNQPHGVVTDD